MTIARSTSGILFCCNPLAWRDSTRPASGASVQIVKTPERTTAAAFPRYAAGEVLADSASLRWKGLFVRRYRFPRVVDRFLVPVTPEPLISCSLAGSAEFRERELGGAWL